MAFDTTAKEILKKAYARIGSYEKVAAMYDTKPHYVRWAVADSERGFEATIVRKILRANIAHIQAAKRSELLESLDNNSKYKGTREVEVPKKVNRLKELKPL